MPGYISSNNNRFYVGVEASYGMAAAAQDLTRIPAVSLKAKRERERVQRRDKTGTRTFLGLPAQGRFGVSFELVSYMASWTNQNQPPCHGALLEALMGASGRPYPGGAVAAANGTQVSFTAPHGLEPGQAVTLDGEMRFVNGVVDASTVQLNAPFSAGAAAGSPVGATYTYAPGSALKSASIMDYWSPDTAVHRILPGAAINRLTLDVNGDFHAFHFSGAAADVLDSASFVSGQAGLQQFPEEPPSANFDHSIVPGHLGQAWMGSVPAQFFTLASAQITVTNNFDLRAREFGEILPRAIAAGQRAVRVDFSVYAQDDGQTKALYQAARQQSPMSVMLQLGQQTGQLCGVFLKSVVAETPEFDDRETRLIWSFKACRAQGSGDDEIVVAFG